MLFKKEMRILCCSQQPDANSCWLSSFWTAHQLMILSSIFPSLKLSLLAIEAFVGFIFFALLKFEVWISLSPFSGPYFLCTFSKHTFIIIFTCVYFCSTVCVALEPCYFFSNARCYSSLPPYFQRLFFSHFPLSTVTCGKYRSQVEAELWYTLSQLLNIGAYLAIYFSTICKHIMGLLCFDYFVKVFIYQF